MKDDGDVWKAALILILLAGGWNWNCRADATGIILFDLYTNTLRSNGQNVIVDIHQSQSMLHTLLLSTSTTSTSYLSDIDLIIIIISVFYQVDIRSMRGWCRLVRNEG